MNLNQKDREKLIKCMEEIVNYIGTEIAPHIINEIKFACLGLNFKIKPYKYHFISINDNDYEIFFPNKREYFIEEENNNLKPLNLTESDDYMIVILNNWNIIKEKCLEEVKYSKEIIDKINNFKI